MIEKWKITTAPGLEPVTLDEMKLHLRVTCDADDAVPGDVAKACLYCM